MNNIIITFEDGSKKEYRRGIKLEEIIKDIQPEEEIICASFGSTLISYEDTINRSGKLFLYGINSSYGNRVYEKGLIFLFKKSAIEVLGKDTNIKIRNSIDRGGIFFEVDKIISYNYLIRICRFLYYNSNIYILRWYL